MINNIKNKAFTLAEILIVVGIIGVTAALTIPNLGDNVEEDKNINQAIKMYNQFETAYNAMSLKYGNQYNWKTDNATGLMTKMAEFLNLQRSCGANTSGCWYVLNSTSPSALFEDGSSFLVENSKQIVIDTNGPNKGPNVFGQDLFRMFIHSAVLSSVVKPYSSDTSTASIKPLTKGSSPGENTYMQWVLEYKNQDYLHCTVTWANKTSCN